MHRLLKALVLCALCLPGVSLAAKGSVAFINPGGDDGFWGDVTAVMKEASHQLDVQLEVLHSNRNRLLMLQHAKEVASREQRPDTVIVVNELEQGSNMLRVLSDAKIPVYFLLNTLSTDQIQAVEKEVGYSPQIVGSIIPENFQAGHEMLVRVVHESRLGNPDKKISVLAILGDELTPAALQREAGMHAAIAEQDGVELARAFSVLWDPDAAFNRVLTAMALIDFDVIWAANDALALASKKAVKQSCETEPCKQIPVVGLNWSADGLTAVANGELVSSHGGHFMAGGYAIAAIYNHFRGKQIPSSVTLHMESIDSETLSLLDTTLNKQRWSSLNFVKLADSLAPSQQRFEPILLFTNSDANYRPDRPTKTKF